MMSFLAWASGQRNSVGHPVDFLQLEVLRKEDTLRLEGTASGAKRLLKKIFLAQQSHLSG